jgi:hypothetical protein
MKTLNLFIILTLFLSISINFGACEKVAEEIVIPPADKVTGSFIGKFDGDYQGALINNLVSTLTVTKVSDNRINVAGSHIDSLDFDIVEYSEHLIQAKNDLGNIIPIFKYDIVTDAIEFRYSIDNHNHGYYSGGRN